jgi:hypothetical protein
MTVMAVMLAPPMGVGRERHQTAQRAQPIVDPAGSKERAVAAIMLNDEDTHTANDQYMPAHTRTKSPIVVIAWKALFGTLTDS